MTQIRVDPLQLLESAHQLAGLSAKLAELAEEAGEAGESAPSYDGQFGPQVQAMAGELQSMITKQAQRLAELTSDLRILSEEFAKADQESVSGIAGLNQALREWASELGLLAEDGSIAWGPLSSFLLGLAQPRQPLAPLTAPMGAGDRPPWWGPLVQGMQRIWSWFDSTVAEPLRDIPETWRGNLENLRIIEAQAAAHGWFAYDRTINQFIYDRLGTWRDNFAMLNTIWTEKLWAVQEPGLPADGPISEAMLTMSALDSNGIPISPVGADLVRLIDERGGVGVHFSDVITDGTAGVTPFKGLVVLPNAYTDPSTQSAADNAALVGHELAHTLQRDLPEFPDGIPLDGSWPMAGSWPVTPDGIDPGSFEYGFPILGDFTLYMEVQSNIVGKAIEYDLLAVQLASLPAGSLDAIDIADRMDGLANDIATYTGTAADAAAYVVQDYDGHEMYIGEMVKEVIFGARIPDGGWEHWLSQQGFSNESIDHIQEIANQGVPESVWLSGMLESPGTSAAIQSTPTPTATPSVTPTTVPSPTLSPSPSPTPSSTPQPPSPALSAEPPD